VAPSSNNALTAWLWDVTERSLGGHERRRRLALRMTCAEAREWEATCGGTLDRVDESEAPVTPASSRGSSRGVE
jgi:hypothetical protein